MEESNSQVLSSFLDETAFLIDRVDELPFDTAAELYDMLDEAAQSATSIIAGIDPELRVEICARQDIVLERIIDTMPPLAYHGKPKHVYTPAVLSNITASFRKWKNVELMKDKCLAGYLLSKEIGGHAVMNYGTKPSDYPYLSIFPDLELQYNDSSIESPEPYHEHLRNNFSQMDILILHGMYNQAVRYLDEYRNLRKDGKVYCGLDMQNYWMENISWDSPNAIAFAQQCDVIATSGRSMRDVLNRNPKTHFPCRWLPNGFLNPTGINVAADPENKENVILTVGRIGSPQKNNEELLIAFARVSDELIGWSLRLVGAIEPKFQSYIEHYFSKRPDLKERVVFTGAITDKKELYGEYARAKVFALTSPLEGGTPNVYAEALFHGCMFVTSNIDASDDITNYGQFGSVYTLGDFDALCDTLVKVCSGANKRKFQKHIPKALEYAMKYYDWNRNVKKLAYMLFFRDRNVV